MRKLSIFLLAALSSSSVAPMSGCVLNCTLVACMGTLTMSIPVALEDGAYDLEVTGDEFDRVVVFEVIDGLAVLDEEASTEMSMVERTEDALVVKVMTGMTEDPPEILEVVLSDEDAEVVYEGEGEPSWGEPNYPNGKHCGDPCQSGSVTLEL